MAKKSGVAILESRFSLPSAIGAWDVAEPGITEEDELLGEIEEWNSALTEFKRIAQDKLYKVPDFGLADLRYHLLIASRFVATAQELAFKAEQLGESFPALIQGISKVDREVKDLVDTIHKWHGSLETQCDIPSDFLEAVKEMEENDGVDLREVIHGRKS